MKKLTKILCTLVMALLLAVTSFGHNVYAAGSTDKTTVTISNVEEDSLVALYQVVSAEYEGTAPNEKFKGYKLAPGLIGPEELVEVVNGTDTKLVEASLLDADKDGKVDATYTDSGVTYTVPTEKQLVIYDMQKPTQEQIFRVVGDGLIGDKVQEKSALAGDYVSFVVPAGQYIALIDSTPTGKDPLSIYSPVVVSAGYTQINKMDRSPLADATHYKLANGGFTNVAPTADTYFLYENAALNTAGEVVFAADESYTLDATTTVSLLADEAYVPTYKADGSTTITELIGKDLDLIKDPATGEYTKYDWTLEGNNATAKRQDGPNVDKEIDPSTNIGTEEVNVKMIAVDKDSEAMRNTAGELLYIHKDYELEDFLSVVNAVADAANHAPTFKLEGGKYVKALNATGDGYADADGTTVLSQAAAIEAMVTNNPDLALQKPKTIYSAAVGTEIPYVVTPTIPVYPKTANDKVLILEDKMSEALDFKLENLNGDPYLPVQISFKSGKAVEHVVVTDTATEKQYDYYIALGKNFAAADDQALIDFNVGLTINGSTVSLEHQGAYLYKDGTSYVVITEANKTDAEGKPVYQYLGSTFIPAADGNDFQLNLCYNALPGALINTPEAPVVRYVGILNEKAVSGIDGATNVAKFFYNNKPGTGDDFDPSEKNPPTGVNVDAKGDKVVVYSYELSMRKTNDKDEFISAPDGTTETKYYMIDETVLNDTANAEFKKWVLDNGTPMTRKESAKAIWFVAENDVIPTEYQSLIDKSDSNAYIINPEFEVLEGAVFGVYNDAACLPEHLVFELETNEYGFGIATDEQAKLLKKGTYYLKEIKAPAGYALSNIITPVEVDWATAITTINTTTTTKTYTPVKEIAPESNPGTATQYGWLVLSTGQSLDNATWVEPSTYTEAQWTEASSTLLEYEYEVGGVKYNVQRVVIDTKEVYRAYLLKETTDTVNGLPALTYNEGAGTVMVNRVNNTKTSELPSTGGIGTYMFTIAGVAILALASFMLIFRKREQHQ